MRLAYVRSTAPDAHEPIPNPAMKLDRTIETIAVVTPN